MPSYVSLQFVSSCPSDRPSEQSRLLDLERVLQPWLSRKGFGYEGRALRSAEDALDEALDVDRLLAAVGAFPILWLNVSFPEGALSADEVAVLARDVRLVPFYPQ